MITNYFINQNGQIPEILLYGYINSWEGTDSKRFVSDFKKLEATNSRINVRINSGGGDCFEGITIFNAIKNSTAEVHIYIDGLAASMASVIALAGKKIFMSRFSQLMIHKVSGTANGSSDKLRETATLMDNMEKSLIEIYATKTGLSIEEIQMKWMVSGKDTWFTASQAIEQNLVDEIFDNGVKKSPAKNKSQEDVWQFYNQQIENNYKTEHMEILSQFISFLKLNENANAQDVLAAIQNQVNQNKDLNIENEKLKVENSEFKNKLLESDRQKVKDLIDNAVKSQRITEEHRATYVALAEANFEATKVALNAITPYKSIVSQLQLTNEDATEYKTFKEYQENDPAALAEMKINNQEKFNSLFKKEFGKLPKQTSL